MISPDARVITHTAKQNQADGGRGNSAEERNAHAGERVHALGPAGRAARLRVAVGFG